MIEIQDGVAVSVRAMVIAHGNGAVVVAGSVFPSEFPACAVMVPAATQVVGEAATSLAAAEAIEEFWFGLRPLTATRRATGGSAVPAESTGAR